MRILSSSPSSPWLGDRRVAGSSPATDHNMESGPVAGEVPVHFLGYCRGALEQGTVAPMCSPGDQFFYFISITLLPITIAWE